MSRRVIQIEFNELSPHLLEDFMSRGLLPHFSRFHAESFTCTTDAQAAEPLLEPWVQWPTVHYGAPHETHGIRHLGDPGPEGLVPVAQVLSDAGVRVGVCGSMNIPYGTLNGFLLPDPWNKRSEPQPSTLAPYRRTVGHMVRESSRESGATSGAGLPAFGRFMLRHGLSPRTVALLVRQLASERRTRGVSWRRASALDWLQYDLFTRLVRRHDVQFATFFSNSTAHYQHYYWRHMAPEAFTTPVDDGDHASLRTAILFGYQSMDRLLGRFLRDFPDALLILCTALSQEPWRDATKMTYRPKDIPALLPLAGVPADSVAVHPIMAEQFILRFPTETAAVDAHERFSRLTVDGEPLLRFTRNGDSLLGGCAIEQASAKDRPITGARDGRSRTLGEVFYPIHTVRSGRHNPDGVLWIRTGQAEHATDRVALTDIAPTVLAELGVEAPPHMTGRALQISRQHSTPH